MTLIVVVELVGPIH